MAVAVAALAGFTVTAFGIAPMMPDAAELPSRVVIDPVPLAGLIDFEKEKARLDKEAGKLANELAGLEKRLGNADFISRAAADVVEASRARAAELQDQIAKLHAMIAAL